MKLGQGGDIFNVVMDAALGSRMLNEVGGESLEEVSVKLPQALAPWESSREGIPTANISFKIYMEMQFAYQEEKCSAFQSLRILLRFDLDVTDLIDTRQPSQHLSSKYDT